MYDIKRAKRLSQALVHFVTARASLCTDQRMSGLPLRHMYKHFKRIGEQTFDKCSHRLQFFPFFEMIVVKTWCGDLMQLLNLCYLPFRNIFPPISSHDLPCHNT